MFIHIFCWYIGGVERVKIFLLGIIHYDPLHIKCEIIVCTLMKWLTVKLKDIIHCLSLVVCLGDVDIVLIF